MNPIVFPFGSRALRRAIEAGLLAFTASMLLPSSSSGAPGPPCRTDLPVTVTIGDLDANGLPVTFASDGLGDYHHGVDQVQSYLPSGGCNADWFLIFYNSPTRRFNQSIREEDAVPPGDPNFTVPPTPEWWGSRLEAGQLKTHCINVGKSLSAMAAGSTMTCPLLNGWKSDQTGFDWGINPAKSLNGFPEVTDAQIRCNTVGADGKCNDWFIDPIDPGPAVARLIEGVPCKGKCDPKVNHGTFYMRFHIHITRP